MLSGLNRIIECKICKKQISIRNITGHLSTHNINFIDYVKRNMNDFPNWKECPICHNNLTNGRTCSKECDTEFRHQQTGEKAVRWGAKLSDQTKEKISNTRKRQGNFQLGRKRSIETKQKMKDYWKGKRTGKDNGMYGKTHTPEAVKKILSHRQMNKFEESVAELLVQNGYEYTFQFFITDDKVCKSYDFKIKGKPIIIETDGDFWHGNPESKYHWKDADKVIQNDKIKENMANNRGYKIIRIWQSEFKNNPSILLEKLQNVIFI